MIAAFRGRESPILTIATATGNGIRSAVGAGVGEAGRGRRRAGSEAVGAWAVRRRRPGDFEADQGVAPTKWVRSARCAPGRRRRGPARAPASRRAGIRCGRCGGAFAAGAPNSNLRFPGEARGCVDRLGSLRRGAPRRPGATRASPGGSARSRVGRGRCAGGAPIRGDAESAQPPFGQEIGESQMGSLRAAHRDGCEQPGPAEAWAGIGLARVRPGPGSSGERPRPGGARRRGPPLGPRPPRPSVSRATRAGSGPGIGGGGSGAGRPGRRGRRWRVGDGVGRSSARRAGPRGGTLDGAERTAPPL